MTCISKKQFVQLLKEKGIPNIFMNNYYFEGKILAPLYDTYVEATSAGVIRLLGGGIGELAGGFEEQQDDSKIVISTQYKKPSESDYKSMEVKITYYKKEEVLSYSETCAFLPYGKDQIEQDNYHITMALTPDKDHLSICLVYDDCHGKIANYIVMDLLGNEISRQTKFSSNLEEIPSYEELLFVHPSIDGLYLSSYIDVRGERVYRIFRRKTSHTNKLFNRTFNVVDPENFSCYKELENPMDDGMPIVREITENEYHAIISGSMSDDETSALFKSPRIVRCLGG